MEISVSVERVDEEKGSLPTYKSLRENVKSRKKRGKGKKVFTGWRCEECGKVLADKAGLKTHRLTHGTELPFHCKECSYRGKTSKYLSRHVMKVHREPPRVVSCKYCDKTFRYNSHLIKHERIHTGEKPNKCKVCGKAFNAAYSLATHLLIHTEERPFQCEYCDYACRDHSTLRKHHERHLGIKRYKCESCKRSCDSKYKLREHILQMHTQPDVRSHACDRCSSAYKSKSALQRHQEVVHDRRKVCTCTVCGKELKNSYGLVEHMRYHVDATPYACAFDGCTAKFKNKSDLSKHSIIHYPEKHVLCAHCGRGFARKHRLAAHIVFPGSNPGVLRLLFLFQSDLSKHSIIHYPEKHVLCAHCGRGFARKHRLAAHIQKMHDKPNKKEHRCQHCGVCFLTVNYLSKHVRTKHAVDRQQFICDTCGFKTYNKPSIVMHVKYSHTRSKKTGCTICGKRYKRQVLLKLHYKNCHDDQLQQTNTRATPEVEIKVEPVDTPELEIDLLDIDKEELTATDCEVEDPSKTLKHDFENQRLRDLFKKMIHDPDFSCDANSTYDSIKNAKAENQTPDLPQYSALPEDLIQQDMLMLIGDNGNIQEPGCSKFNELTKTVENMTEAETRTEDPGDEYYDQIDEKVYNTATKENDLTQQYNISEQIYEEAQPQLDGSTESHINVTEAENRTENTQKGPMHVQEFIEKMVGDMEDPITNEDETYTLDKDLHEQVKQQIIEMILKHRRAHNDDRTIVGRKSVKRIAPEDIKPTRPSMHRNTVYQRFTPRTIIQKKPRNPRPKRIFYELKPICETTVEEAETELGKRQRRVPDFYETSKAIQIRRYNEKRKVFNRKRKVHNEKGKDHNEEGKVHNEEGKVHNEERKVHNEERKVPNEEIQVPNGEREETQNMRELIKPTTKITDNYEIGDTVEKKSHKLVVNSYQCNVCYKLFETRPQLLDHCQIHFDICNESTLMKCPLCNVVAEREIRKHFKTVHKEDISISFMKILDRPPNENGSRYYYNTENDKAKEIDIIPSVKILHKKAGMDLDKRNRDQKNRTMSVPKLVKKGKEWIVAKEKFDVSGYVLPNAKELDKNDVDYLKKLKQLGIEAKEKGVKMLYPCNKCEKVCQNLSAVTLHARRHDPNKKPYAPKVYKHKLKDNSTEIIEKARNSVIDINNRLAKPKPIVNKHKCDPKLREFYETNVRGLNIEFWQFLKIYNKMERENIKDFEDLKNTTDYGLGHFIEENVSVNNKDDVDKTAKTNSETSTNNKKSQSRTSWKNNNLASVKNKYTRTIRISRTEHNKRKQIQKKLREKLANPNIEK